MSNYHRKISHIWWLVQQSKVVWSQIKDLTLFFKGLQFWTDRDSVPEDPSTWVCSRHLGPSSAELCGQHSVAFCQNHQQCPQRRQRQSWHRQHRPGYAGDNEQEKISSRVSVDHYFNLSCLLLSDGPIYWPRHHPHSKSWDPVLRAKWSIPSVSVCLIWRFLSLNCKWLDIHLQELWWREMQSY